MTVEKRKQIEQIVQAIAPMLEKQLASLKVSIMEEMYPMMEEHEETQN